MALLKIKDIRNMSTEERKNKLEELKLELIKSNVLSKKSSSKAKEIKRVIARIMTINKSVKTEEKK